MYSAQMVLLEKINFSKIHSPHLEQTIEKIKQFPDSKYRILSTRNNFYRDFFFIEDGSMDYIKYTIQQGHAWEPSQADYIVRYALPGSVAIDIGAHIGTHTMTMARSVGSSGTVISIEPNEQIFQELVLNVSGLCGLNNVEYYLNGASNESIVMENSHLNNNQSVEMITIDSLNLTNVSLIKIDTDGTPENSVLKGAKNTIINNKPVILLEIAGGVNYKTADQIHRNNIDSTKQYVVSLGYQLISLGDLGQGCPWDYLCLPTH